MYPDKILLDKIGLYQTKFTRKETFRQNIPDTIYRIKSIGQNKPVKIYRDKTYPDQIYRTKYTGQIIPGQNIPDNDRNYRNTDEIVGNLSENCADILYLTTSKYSTVKLDEILQNLEQNKEKMKLTTYVQHEPIVNIVKVPTNPNWGK